MAEDRRCWWGGRWVTAGAMPYGVGGEQRGCRLGDLRIGRDKQVQGRQFACLKVDGKPAALLYGRKLFPEMAATVSVLITPLAGIYLAVGISWLLTEGGSGRGSRRGDVRIERDS